MKMIASHDRRTLVLPTIDATLKVRHRLERDVIVAPWLVVVVA
jgi:hypothetical protein